MKLLAIGDLHIGRSPSRLPACLAERTEELGPAGIWRKLVNKAIEDEVNAVILAGDIVEGEHDFFEAFRKLDEGIRNLLQAGIQVLGVGGNHDVEVLPRLADQIDGFQLLGRDGQWERTTLQANHESFTLHGWSFPRNIIRNSPLADHRFERGPGPNFGLLHCDRDQAASVYAPVSTAQLKAAGLDGWLLGHIHLPDQLSLDQPIGYLGSAVGLDPGEPGDHGPWLITIRDGRLEAFEHCPMEPLRWESLQVDLTGIQAPEDARERLLATVSKLNQSFGSRSNPPLAAGLRVAFTGRTKLRPEIEEVFKEENLEELHCPDANTRFFVERLLYATQPLLNMAELAKRTDPPGLLARRLQLLDRGPEDEERQRLIRNTRRRLSEVANRPHWSPVSGPSVNDDRAVADWLRQAGLAALDQLLAQEETVK